MAHRKITAMGYRGSESKGGVEATVKIAKADLVPSDANLLPAYGSFAGLEEACREFCGRVNARAHRETAAVPLARLAAEREMLHPLPDEPDSLQRLFQKARRTSGGPFCTWRVPAMYLSRSAPLMYLAGSGGRTARREGSAPGGTAGRAARVRQGQARSQLVHTLIEHDLVDELRLMINPLVPGVGERLFGQTSDTKPVRLADTRAVGDGLAFLTC